MHIILLDNRFSYNTKAKDRLGDQQWEWLDRSLKEHRTSNLTVILAGIQMIKDNGKL